MVEQLVDQKVPQRAVSKVEQWAGLMAVRSVGQKVDMKAEQ